MKGKVTCWMPGMDHAGIATQNVVERLLLKEGKTKYDLGREEFVKRVWKWKEHSGGQIKEQLKRLGCSLDWERERFTLDEGLSQGQVEFMIKDVNGFLWMGTGNGLNRFDGKKFKIFFHDPGNPSTISGNAIVGLVEDSLHNIWAGTQEGLSRYDIRADTFTNFISSAKNALFNAIKPLWATQNEVYCLENDLQITIYDVHSFKKKNLLKLTPADKANTGSSFFDIATNSIWMLYGAGLEAGLLQVSLTDGSKNIYSWPTYKKFPNPLQTVPCMCYDKRKIPFGLTPLMV